MKTTTSNKFTENFQTALISITLLATVLSVNCMSWFA
jgi:hypothetical protein